MSRVNAKVNVNTDLMRRRARRALTPTWPQVRTFPPGEIERDNEQFRAWERRESDHLGPISQWVNDIRARAPHVQLRTFVTHTERGPVVTIQPEEDQ